MSTAKAIAQVFAELPQEKQREVLAKLSDEDVAELQRCHEVLFDFIPRVSTALEPPRHLAPLVDVIVSTVDRPRKMVVSTPPQHGKTETCMHGLVWLMDKLPTRRHAYVTYEADSAEKISEKTQRIATAAGVCWS